MARPRRPYSGVETVMKQDHEWQTNSLPGVLGVRQRGRWDASTKWSYRTPNGQFDPLTILFVIDAVCSIDPDIELRAKNLAAFLNSDKDQLIWDPIIVGKALSDLCEAFEDVLGRGNGILERGKDFRGAFYLIHHSPDVFRLWYKLREDLMRLVGLEMANQANRIKGQRLVSPLLECTSVRGEYDRAAIEG